MQNSMRIRSRKPAEIAEIAEISGGCIILPSSILASAKVRVLNARILKRAALSPYTQKIAFPDSFLTAHLYFIICSRGKNGRIRKANPGLPGRSQAAAAVDDQFSINEQRNLPARTDFERIRRRRQAAL